MNHALTLSDLRVVSEQGVTLLSVPSLAIPAGASLGIKGASGAGKTTLLMCLAGLVKPQSGSVRWGPDDITALSMRQMTRFRREKMGLVFQQHLLFDELSATANASIAALYEPKRQRQAIHERAQRYLQELNIQSSAATVAQFSGGEQQRVALARALAKDPDILLADEPTASLDRATANLLIDDLVRIKTQFGKTLVVVSHDPQLVDRMDYVLTLGDGCIQELRENA